MGVGPAGVLVRFRQAVASHRPKGKPAALGAVDTRRGVDGSLLRRDGLRGRHFRLRNGLGTLSLVVIVAGPARVRLLAAGTKFRAHRYPLAYWDVRS